MEKQGKPGLLWVETAFALFLPQRSMIDYHLGCETRFIIIMWSPLLVLSLPPSIRSTYRRQNLWKAYKTTQDFVPPPRRPQNTTFCNDRLKHGVYCILRDRVRPFSRTIMVAPERCDFHVYGLDYACLPRLLRGLHHMEREHS